MGIKRQEGRGREEGRCRPQGQGQARWPPGGGRRRVLRPVQSGMHGPAAQRGICGVRIGREWRPAGGRPARG